MIIKIFLFSHCDEYDYEIVKDRIGKDDLIVGVDSGSNILYEKKIEPDIVIGDSDSIDKNAYEYFKKLDKLIEYPVEKNATDNELAIDWAAKKNPDLLVMINNLRGRLDHIFGLISNLEYAIDKNINTEVVNSSETVYLVRKGISLEKKNRKNLGLVALTEKVEDLTLIGCKYSLNQETIFRNSTRSISNEITNDKIQIDFTKGKLLVILY